MDMRHLLLHCCRQIIVYWRCMHWGIETKSILRTWRMVVFCSRRGKVHCSWGDTSGRSLPPRGCPPPGRSCTVPVLYCTVLYCTVLNCTVLYWTILYWYCCTNTVPRVLVVGGEACELPLCVRHAGQAAEHALQVSSPWCAGKQGYWVFAEVWEYISTLLVF